MADATIDRRTVPMTPQLRTWLAGLDKRSRCMLMAEVSLGLTIAIRMLASNDDASRQSVQSIRFINEVNHAIANYLVGVVRDDEDGRRFLPTIEYMFSTNDNLARDQIEFVWKNAVGSVSRT